MATEQSCCLRELRYNPQHQHAVDRNGKVNSVPSQRITAKEQESRLRIPEYPRLKRWMIVKRIGEGAFGNVYRAKSIKRETPDAAIKVFRKCDLSISQKENVLEEVRIMRLLHHENIVGFIGFSESDDYYYIILELCPGGDLFDQIIRFTYFSEDLARHVIIQVARAIKYLHQYKGVIHRDIKPENILFSPIPFHPSKATDREKKADEGYFISGLGSGGIGHVKLGDFGLSSHVCEPYETITCGTIGYAAPEIVKGEPSSKSVDMWSLGCVLYAFLCGFTPFRNEDVEVLKAMVAGGKYSFPSPWWDDISNSAKDLVSRLLKANSAERYTIEEFLNHPWILEAELLTR